MAEPVNMKILADGGAQLASRSHGTVTFVRLTRDQVEEFITRYKAQEGRFRDDPRPRQ